MTSHRSSLLQLLDERGYIHQVTDAAALDALAEKQPDATSYGIAARKGAVLHLHLRGLPTALRTAPEPA